MPAETLIHNARLLVFGGAPADGWLLAREGRIADLGRGAPPATDGQRLDAQGAILAPGLVDLHVHGALGHDTMDATPEALGAIAGFQVEHGVTSFLATTMSRPTDEVLAALRNVAAVNASGGVGGGARILGAHVEGPYLDAGKSGAQDPAHICPASSAEYAPLFATGAVRLLTVAPEYPANEALIAYAVAQGAVVAIGHTRASYDAVCRAVALGASQVTHLYNGMEALHHREPGAVGAALTLDTLRCQLIADGIHVHPAVLALTARCKGVDGIILVSDAMAGTGMPDGAYSLGGRAVTVREGVARIANGALAGSTLTLERAVRTMHAAAGLGLADALGMATRTPAHALGLERRLGALVVGLDADLILLDDDVHVRMTMVGGRVVYRS